MIDAALPESCQSCKHLVQPVQSTIVSRRRNCILDHVIAGYHKEFILVVEDHAERHALQLLNRQIPSTRIKNLYALHVADIHTAISIDRNRICRAKLPGLVTGAAKAIYELPIASELEDCIVKPAESIDVPGSVNRHSHTQFRVATGTADRGRDRLHYLPVCIERDDVVTMAVQGSY